MLVDFYLGQHQRPRCNLQVTVNEVKRESVPRDGLHEQSGEGEEIEGSSRCCLTAELAAYRWSLLDRGCGKLTMTSA